MWFSLRGALAFLVVSAVLTTLTWTTIARQPQDERAAARRAEIRAWEAEARDAVDRQWREGRVHLLLTSEPGDPAEWWLRSGPIPCTPLPGTNPYTPHRDRNHPSGGLKCGAGFGDRAFAAALLERARTIRPPEVKSEWLIPAGVVADMLRSEQALGCSDEASKRSVRIEFGVARVTWADQTTLVLPWKEIDGVTAIFGHDDPCVRVGLWRNGRLARCITVIPGAVLQDTLIVREECPADCHAGWWHIHEP